MFTNLRVPYGRSRILIRVPSSKLSGIIRPKKSKPLSDIDSYIKRKFSEVSFREQVYGKKGITLIVNDITRPKFAKLILPETLLEMKKVGINFDDIKFIIASGVHRSHSLDEIKELVGDFVFGRFKVVENRASDKKSFSFFGRTSYGTDLWLNKCLEDSDFTIAIGNVEAHWFAGYTGGAKSILPGISFYETVEQNHSMMFSPGAYTCNLDDNPVRRDIDEAGKIASLDLIINAVLDHNKKPIDIFIGNPIKAHREAVKKFDEIYKIPIKKKADIVIASVGGFPKDINLYQAQKGMEYATYALKRDGVLILLAECREGYGDRIFEKYMLSNQSPEEIVEELKERFTLGAHKTYGFIKALTRARKIILISSIDHRRINKRFLTPAKNIEQALKIAFDEVGHDSQIFVIPYAGLTIPYPEKGDSNIREQNLKSTFLIFSIR